MAVASSYEGRSFCPKDSLTIAPSRTASSQRHQSTSLWNFFFHPPHQPTPFYFFFVLLPCLRFLFTVKLNTAGEDTNHPPPHTCDIDGKGDIIIIKPPLHHPHNSFSDSNSRNNRIGSGGAGGAVVESKRKEGRCLVLLRLTLLLRCLLLTLLLYLHHKLLQLLLREVPRVLVLKHEQLNVAGATLHHL